MMLLSQGFAALISGDQRVAGERFTEGLRIARQLDDRVAQCHLLGGLACCAAGSRQPRLARSSSVRWRPFAPKRGRTSTREWLRHWRSRRHR